MFRGLGDAAYSDIFANIFGGGTPGSSTGTATNDQGGGTDDLITTMSTGARTTSSAELSARLTAAGGAMDVEVNSSDYIVAANNPLRFSTTRLASGQYRITANNNLLYLGGGAAALLLLLLVASK